MGGKRERKERAREERDRKKREKGEREIERQCVCVCVCVYHLAAVARCPSFSSWPAQKVYRLLRTGSSSCSLALARAMASLEQHTHTHTGEREGPFNDYLHVLEDTVLKAMCDCVYGSVCMSVCVYV